MAAKNETFEENYKRLETLAQELQENKIPIDALVPRMKEALQAIKVCKEVLKETKAQLKELSTEFNELNSAE
jgi:exodeoxyribonuclease VII small subunit